MRCHLVNALAQVGGQLSEIYPHYDIPGYPQIMGQELVDKLMIFVPLLTIREKD